MSAESPWPFEPWGTREDRFSPTLFRGPELPRFPRRSLAPPILPKGLVAQPHTSFATSTMSRSLATSSS